MAPDRDKAARELLSFYSEAGVDAVLGETPIDRLTQSAPPPESARPAGQDVHVPAGESEPGPRTPSAVRPPLVLGDVKVAAPAAPAAPDVAVMAITLPDAGAVTRPVEVTVPAETDQLIAEE